MLVERGMTMDDNKYQSIQERIKKSIGDNEKAVVFGCGAVAGMLCHALRDLKIEAEYFIVNDGHRKEAFCQGKRVLEVSEITQSSDIGVVYYGINEKSDAIAEKVREAFGERLIYEDYKVVLCALLEEFYREYFAKHNIDITQDELCLGECKLVNPFRKDVSYRLELLTPLRDIVLPIMFDDYEHIDEGTYELGSVRLEAGQVIFDCGANVGVFSAVAASRGAQVYAFEPIEQVVQQLRETQALYPEQIHTVPFALSDKISSEDFYVDEGYGAVCTMCGELSGKSSKKISIQTTTIDSFIEENHVEKLDMIKADIEGAERHMLLGAADTLRRMQPKLAIATYHLPDDAEVLARIIHEINPAYLITHKWKMLYAYVPQ